MPLKIAIIGAGAAGLGVLRHALTSPSQFSPVVFELGDRVGGTWVYTDKIGRDDYGQLIHSSMYKSLRTNIPKEVMNFPDFPFKEDLPSFVRHEDVLEYLEDYASHFGLYDHIKFQTSVDNVQPIREGDDVTKVKWKVTYSQVTNPSVTKCDIFDGVVVCSGHYFKPQVPPLKGLDKFEHEVIHSHDYRTPEQFKDKKILVLGAGASGQDIALDLSQISKKIYLSHNKPRLLSSFPDNVEQVPGIEEVLENSVKLLDGREVQCDVIFFCTGYHVSFPFLGPECEVKIEEERITPLYKHIVHTTYPTMCFVGMCRIVCPFPNFHLQAQFSLKVIDGTITLPSKEEMDEETTRDYESRLEQGLPHRHAHLMGPRQWEYNNTLSTMAGVEPIASNVQALYDYVHNIRRTQFTTFKKLNFKLIGSDTFQTIQP